MTDQDQEPFKPRSMHRHGIAVDIAPDRGSQIAATIIPPGIMPKRLLKACPFCGLPGVFTKEGRGGASLYTAGCPNGHAVSPELETKKEAVDWWNRRHEPRGQKK